MREFNAVVHGFAAAAGAAGWKQINGGVGAPGAVGYVALCFFCSSYAMSGSACMCLHAYRSRRHWRWHVASFSKVSLL